MSHRGEVTYTTGSDDVMMNPTYNVVVQNSPPLKQKDEAIDADGHTNFHTDKVEEKMVNYIIWIN